MNDIVTDPVVLARLPAAGKTAWQWHWFWFGWTWDMVRGRRFRGRCDWSTWRFHFFCRMRMANAESISIGPLNITKPMPWLAGPARALHPEAFADSMPTAEWIATEMELRRDEAARLKALINTPELERFLRAVHIEAVHQIERWGTSSDRAKRPADWFWLVGYLGGKALHAAVGGDREKALHHCISTAAALYNWHCSIKGVDVRMCPGRSDLAELVEGQFPGEVPQ